MAGLSEAQDEDDAIAAINIVPFVDIVLVLLIIFLLTANIIAKGSIPVDLPQAAHASDVVDPTANIVIAPNGDLFLDGQAVSREAMVAGARERFAANPKLRVVIAADKSVRYELVVAVIDAIKHVGISAFALDIERTAP